MRRLWWLLPLAMVLACREPLPPPGTPRRVESPALELAFSDLPRACAVAANEGERLVFACDLEGSRGEVEVEVSAPERVNLLEAARQQQQHYEGLPEGRFHGNRELVTPLGPAYTARGSYLLDGKRVEEAKVFTLHPFYTNRRVTLLNRYPEGESVPERMEQLMFLTGEMEGLGEGPATGG
jgi:hypothetical protein